VRNDFITMVLENGTTLRVEATPSTDEDVALSTFRFADLRTSVIALAEAVSGILEEVSPTSATAEFGIAVGVETGKLTALLVQGTGAANLKISLTWERSKDDGDGSRSA
jgi:hypothetical protein